MANFGPIQAPSNLSNVTTLPDLIRYVSTFASQVSDSFNGLIKQKSAWGVIGFTGTIISSSNNFGASFVGAGLYYVVFRQPFIRAPSVVLTPWTTGGTDRPVARIDGVTTTGFAVSTVLGAGSGTPTNLQFNFIAMGAG